MLNSLCDEVYTALESWQPAHRYRAEHTVQDALVTHLENQINQSNSFGMSRQAVKIETEATANIDIQVGSDVGVELKHTPDAGDLDRLSGQLERYVDTFPCTIVLAYGSVHESRWHRLQDKYGQTGPMVSNSVSFIQMPKDGKQNTQSDPFGGMF